MRPAMRFAQTMLAILKTKRYVKIIFGKMPITACNAAMWTAVAFLNAQTALAILKTKNGAATELGNRWITAQYAETGTFHAE